MHCVEGYGGACGGVPVHVCVYVCICMCVFKKPKSLCNFPKFTVTKGLGQKRGSGGEGVVRR